MKKVVVKIASEAEELADLKSLGNPKNVDRFPDSTIYFKSAKHLCSILSTQKLTLLQYVAKSVGQPVTKISLGLGRKKEAVSRDLHQLEGLGLLKMQREGNRVYPKVPYKAIEIEL